MNIEYARLMTKLKIERDHHIRCLCLDRIDTKRPRISSICSILSMYQLWLEDLMRPMMFVAVLMIHLFELVMYCRLLFVAMSNWDIVLSVKWAIAAQSLEHSLVNQVFDLEISREKSNI